MNNDNISLNRQPEEISKDITSAKHPFWSASTGSTIKLLLEKPPNSNLKGMYVSVYTISEPYTYKLDIVMSNNEINNTIFLKKKDAIKAIQEEWLVYYGDRTKIEYNEHRMIDMGPLIFNSVPRNNPLRNRSPRNNSPRNSQRNGENTIDSCPPSPSPRDIRRNNFRSMLKEIAEAHRKRSLRDSNSDTPSSTTSSSEVSPRSGDNSPRKSWMNKRLSLAVKKSGDSSPRSGTSSPLLRSSASNKNIKLSDSNSDEDQLSLSQGPENKEIQHQGTQENNVRSPRTSRLLRQASIKLALRLSKNHGGIGKTSTPRNSSSGIEI